MVIVSPSVYNLNMFAAGMWHKWACLLAQQLVRFNRFSFHINALQPQHTNLHTDASVISRVWQSLVNPVDQVDWSKMPTSDLHSLVNLVLLQHVLCLKCNGLCTGPGAWQVQLQGRGCSHAKGICSPQEGGN